MNDSDPPLSISAVERETGLSKDVLRKWEARYGFPQPLRDEFGERIYPPEQVERLRLIKRLMDTGLRPSNIVGKDAATLLSLAATRHVAPQAAPGEALETRAVELLRRHDPEGLRQTLQRLLLRQGLTRFVQDTISPLNRAVGEAWARGELEVYEEHLYTEAVQWVLRNALAALTDTRGGRVSCSRPCPRSRTGLASSWSPPSSPWRAPIASPWGRRPRSPRSPMP
jgi:DNA-binding transcriptional MerR regulator